jgi:iron-sulfur cluster assembly accessory protein
MTESPLLLTSAAADQIRSLTNEHPGKGLRIYVEAGGCSGLQYGMALDEKKPEDQVIEKEGSQIYLDPFSLKYLRGATVDYIDGLTGAGFKIQNPNAKQSCGCGTSFEADKEAPH